MDSSTFYRGVTIIFPLQLCRIEKYFYFSRTSGLVVVCSSSQNRNSTLMSPEWIYLMKTSNWAHEVTSVDSSMWKKHWSWRWFYFIYHLAFHIFRHMWNSPLNNIAVRDVRLTTFSKKLFYCFQQTGFHKRFFLIMWCFRLAISNATSYDACLIGGHFQQDSLTFQTHALDGVGRILYLFVAWLGCFVSKCCINFKGFIYFLALRAF